MKKFSYPTNTVFAMILMYQAFLCSCNQDGGTLSATKAAITKVPFTCTTDCEEVIERWGLSGYSRCCQKNGLRHGKWIAFENERLVIEGNYKFGKEDGRWIWYHSDGRIYRIMEYNEGSEVSDKIINE